MMILMTLQVKKDVMFYVAIYQNVFVDMGENTICKCVYKCNYNV